MNFYQKQSFSSTIKSVKNLDSDQDRPNVGLDLQRNWLQRLSADVRSHH